VCRDSTVLIKTHLVLDGLEIFIEEEKRFSAPYQTFPVSHSASYRMSTELIAWKSGRM